MGRLGKKAKRRKKYAPLRNLSRACKTILAQPYLVSLRRAARLAIQRRVAGRMFLARKIATWWPVFTYAFQRLWTRYLHLASAISAFRIPPPLEITPTWFTTVLASPNLLEAHRIAAEIKPGPRVNTRSPG